jgi:hypothetical protein
MSKLETPMILRYWENVGGTLIWEFPAVKQTTSTGRRLIDAVILPNLPKRVAKSEEVNIEGQDIIVVQAKAYRLGMYLMGQTFFSAELMKKFKPASIRSVALCLKDDDVLRPMLERFPGMEVVVLPKNRAPK